MNLYRTCRKCDVEKCIYEFTPRKTRKGIRYEHRCKECAREYNRNWKSTNREKVESYNKEYYEANREYFSEYCSSYRQKNKDKMLSRESSYRHKNRERIASNKAEYRKSNPDKVNSINARYAARKKRACPDWLNEEHHTEIDSFYTHARDCYLVTGEKYHVDHIVPLQGKNVCGLHVPWNLQVLPSDVNISKGNRV